MAEVKCKYCGCTDDHACEGGCSWVAKDVCSKCAAKLVTVQRMQGQGALLKTTPLTEMRGEKPASLFDVKHQELFVPVEAMILTAEALLNTYQEITGEMIRLKLSGEHVDKDMPCEHPVHFKSYSGANVPQTIKVIQTDRLFVDSPDAGDPVCLCSRCGLAIPDGAGIIRAWPEQGEGEYRYHPECLGAIS